MCKVPQSSLLPRWKIVECKNESWEFIYLAKCVSRTQNVSNLDISGELKMVLKSIFGKTVGFQEVII